MKANKKTYFYLLMIVLCLGNTSCSKLMDVKPQGKIISENYWQNEGQAVGAIAGMYANLSCTNTSWGIGVTNANNLSATLLTPVEAYFYWGEIRGEILTNTVGKMPSAQIMKENVDNYLVSSSDPTTSYGAFYKIINQANMAIKYIPGIPAKDPNFPVTEAEQLVGEAYFVRAFCYFWLARGFKDVPLVLDPYEKDDQDFNIAKTSSNLIFEQIVKDLILAKATLPEWYVNPLYTRVRATQYSSMTLLADVYLWMAAMSKDAAISNDLYDKVIENCAAVRESGRYLLVPTNSYSSIFNSGNTAESIFEQYTNNSIGQASSMQEWFINQQLWSVDPSANLLFTYSTSTDVRGPVLTTSSGFNLTTRLLYKYTNNNARWMFYRLPEVYFMEAEALTHRYPNDAVKLQEACALVNLIRQRAYLPLPSIYPIADATSADAMDDILLDEMGREFIGEGKRWFELVRFASRNNFARKDLLINRILNSRGGTDQLIISPRISNPDSWYLPLNTNELTNNRSLVQNPFYK